ncbi:transcriptional regulator [Arthrobacter sp. MYb227]|uniref:helix-turn-helix domain-containing protein n=1 Tax=Arthrobacter sp. MYb227 TaxID=1848601 RepID=UPI000CFBD32C|nr:helix-turn-helix domain-containing protein [Arthrobacter sp. MYb227]PQZ93768.1 transcriptional regulator [Arthrobacter sp. MYb227]
MKNGATLATSIRTRRKKIGLTQMQLAELAQVSERTVRSMETQRGNPSLVSVLAVLSVLGLKLSLSWVD